MSGNYFTDYTGQLRRTKEDLDGFFRIVAREDAVRIIEGIKNDLEDRATWGAIADKQTELLKLFESVPEYTNRFYTEKRDGTRIPRALITSFRYEGENKDRIDKALFVYEGYAKKLKLISEINRESDKLFIEKLEAVHSDYKSSADYMTRLVNRLIRYNVDDNRAFKETDTTRVLILKQFIKQFDWFKDIKSFDVKDTKELVTEKYKGKYELIDDGIFSNISNPDTAFFGRRITEGFIVAVSKLQGVIKYKAPFIKTDSALIGMIKSIIAQEKLKESGELEKAQLLSDCFNEDSYEVDLGWFKDPSEIGINEELLDILCRVVKDELLTEEAKDGKAKTIGECFKDGSIPSGSDCFRSFDEIEMTPELCKSFYKSIRKAPNEDDKRSEAAKKGKAETLADCFVSYTPDMKITSINSIAMYFYKRISDELEKNAAGCIVKDSTYNDAIKKGGELYDKNRRKLRFYNYDLLQIADDLSRAKFSPHGKTREYLYLFAIAFDIRRVEKGHPDRIVDIEKNLFRDYYADNIVNNLPLVAGLGDDSDVLIDGYGINYKNFAEVIFLWCLQQSGMTAAKRLETAYKLIDYCKNNGKTEEEFYKNPPAGKTDKTLTAAYVDEFLKIKSLPLDSFREYVKENYPCKSKNSGIMQISAEQRTAGKIISMQEERVNSLLKRVEDELLFDATADDLFRILSDDSSLGSFFNEYEYLTNKRCKSCPKNSNSVFPYCKMYFLEAESKDEEGNTVCIKSCSDYYTEYLNRKWASSEDYLMHNSRCKAEDFKPVNEHFEKSFAKINELCSDEQESLKLILNRIKNRLKIDSTGRVHFKKVSRSTIIALSFYEYVLINWLKRSAEVHTLYGSFEKLYDSFCDGDVFVIKTENDDFELVEEEIRYTGVNEMLEKAGYQKINPKNIFDIYLIYIAYRDNFLAIYSSQTDAVVDIYKDYQRVFEEIKRSRCDITVDKNEIYKDR